MKIKINELVINGLMPKPSRTLISSLANLGQLVPILVIRDSYGYIVADGRRRVAAAVELGWDEVEAREIEQDSDLATLHSHIRSRNVVSELRAIKMLISRGLTIDEIARALGKNKRELEKIMTLEALPDDVLQALERRDGVTESVAFALARLEPVYAAKVIEEFREHGLLTAKMIREVKSVKERKETENLMLISPPKDEVQELLDALRLRLGVSEREVVRRGLLLLERETQPFDKIGGI